MMQFLLYSIFGLLFFWAMAVAWSVSAGPASIMPVVAMLLASLLAATSGISLFHRKAGAIIAVTLLAFLVIWPPITFAIHGVSVDEAVFYGLVLAIFVVPVRVLIRPTNAPPQPFTKRQVILYSLLALVPFMLSVVLSSGLWEMVLSPEFWKNVSSHPDIWGLKAH